MKKLLTLIPVLALILAMSMNVFAASGNIDAENGGYNIDVNARYVESVDSPTVYHVDLAWGAMEFTYTVSGAKTWNPETHAYVISVSDSWTAAGNEITVTNHSNTAVKADFAYKAQNGYATVTGSFSQNSLTLPTAEGKALNDAKLVGKTAFTLGGILADTQTNFAEVGTVTVAISKAA